MGVVGDGVGYDVRGKGLVVGKRVSSRKEEGVSFG